MRLLLRPLAALVIICCTLGACGSDKPAVIANPSTVAQGSSDTSAAADASQPIAPAGSVDCATLKTNLADILVNWQVVIGLTNTPSAEWAQIPLGTIAKFGDQVAAVNAALGSDADAAAALPSHRPRYSAARSRDSGPSDQPSPAM